jgi:hypothetical protein
MKTLKLLPLALIMLVIFSASLFSQSPTFKIEVKNQTLVPADPAYGGLNTVYFDLYLTDNNVTPSHPDSLFLSSSDFKFHFNVGGFSAPGIEYVPGTVQLWNRYGASCSTWYETIIGPMFVSPNILAISTNFVTFANQLQFNQRVARIDGTPNHNKLGQFVVYETNLTGSFGLTWMTGVGGTAIIGYFTTTPWNTFNATAGETLIVVPDLPLPIGLTSFTGNVVNKRDVTLIWNTATETNNKGFDIERKLNTTETWSKVGYIDGKGTTTSPTSYRFEDRKLNTGKYNYRLKQMDYNGNFEYYDLNSVIEVGVPTKYDVSQNYPNPFNPTTRIDFDLPFNSKVTMKLYDMSGREVMTLVNDQRTAGYYTETFNMTNLSSGAYFYRIDANGNGQNFVMSKKMMLIK